MNGKKAVLLAHEHLYGGGTKQTFSIAQALVKAGVETVLVSNAERTWLGQAIQESGMPVKTYYSQSICRAIRPMEELKVLCLLLRVFWIEKPDVILSSGVKLIALGGLAGWLCRVPARYAIIRGEGAAPGSLMLKAIYVMERFMALLGTRYITVSDYIRQQKIQKGVCNDRQVKTVHDGIHVTGFAAADEKSDSASGIFTQRYQLPEHAFKIGMVGRLVAGKRYDQFIELMSQLVQEFPHVYGLLIGEGEHREMLEEQIVLKGLSNRVFITGFCSDMPMVYQDLNMSVLLTDYEGCPNSILESLAARVPVLASKVCGIPEIICSGQNGYLIEPGDIAGAVSSIRAIVTDPALGKSLAEAGYQVVLERFNVEHQVRRIVESLFPETDVAHSQYQP